MTVAPSLTDVLPSEALGEVGTPVPWPLLGSAPEAVVHPESTEEVAALLSWASAQRVGVVPIGSGSGLAVRRMEGRFVVLSTNRLTGIEIYEPADLTFTAKAGTRLDGLSAELRAHGQWMPFDPPRVPDRTLGGLVAMGESGPLWMGYGELRNHVLGMTVVCGDGRTLRLGGRVVKNVAGFDLLKPMVGSRGGLAVITSVCLRVFPTPATDRVLVLRAERPEALAAVARSVGTAPLMPVSSVLFAPAQALDAGAALVVRLHGAEATVEADQATLERHLGVVFERADDGPAVLAAARDHALDGSVVLVISLLPSRLADGLAAVCELSPDVAIAVDTYSGIIRVTLGEVDVAGLSRLRAAVEALDGALSVRASATGVDLTGSESALTPEQAELTARLERVFDPEGVLWRRQP